jgi:predicted nucleic acid-binding protein
MFYLDTSLLVAALTPEPRTVELQQWLGQQDPDELAISDWVVAEFSAALAAKLRAGRVDVSERAAALAGFAQLCAGNFTILPLSRAHFQMAARFADQHTLGLRAPDALHVALCLDQGAILCTLDRPLSEACAPLGISAMLL